MRGGLTAEEYRWKRIPEVGAHYTWDNSRVPGHYSAGLVRNFPVSKGALGPGNWHLGRLVLGHLDGAADDYLSHAAGPKPGLLVPITRGGLTTQA